MEDEGSPTRPHLQAPLCFGRQPLIPILRPNLLVAESVAASVSQLPGYLLQSPPTVSGRSLSS